MTVLDASTVVAAIADSGRDRDWAARMCGQGPLSAPHILLAEVTAALRRLESKGAIDPSQALLARLDLADLDVHLFEFSVVADRIWGLRQTMTVYDAWYVALAELLDEPVATLDLRLARAPGAQCDFLTPP